MIPYERHSTILHHLQDARLLKIGDLQELLPGVSLSTLRRDIKELEKSGSVQYLSGGAVRLNDVSHEIDMTTKRALHGEQKEQIAQCATLEVDDGDTVYIDSGSTCAVFLQHLLDRDVVIYTTNAEACRTVRGVRAHLIVVGGELKTDTSSFVGPIAEAILRDLYFDKAFLGVNSISVERGVMNPSFEEASKKRIILENSRRTFLLCDSSKFNRISNVRVFGLDRVTVISDSDDEQIGKCAQIITPQKRERPRS